MPHADGVFLQAGPQQLVLQGSVADIPFVVGEDDDPLSLCDVDAVIARVMRGRRNALFLSLPQHHVRICLDIIHCHILILANW